ncbi:MerC domain-containing protein [Croceibacterium sp. TMG7-5b_MA50]|uniref:MerC domain-containing protein n=1 Tax=Croceibacterium sp. TMG7-5b_MA50 TaxID=3121290 RepID=UPI0032216201
MVPDQPARRTSLAMLDSFAVVASVACMVHCLALPLALALLPILAETLFAGEAFHVAVLLLAVPTSAVALWGATRRPEGRACLLAGAAGLSLMALGLFMPTDRAETAATVAGSLLLAGAHLANWRARTVRLA